MGFQDVGGNLLAAVGGQRMLDHAVRLGKRHAGGVQRKAVEIPAALLNFAFHAHADPHIGKQHVGIAGGFIRVSDEFELIPVGFRQHQHIGGGAVARRAGHRDRHAHSQAAHDHAVRHIVPIADEPGAQPGELAFAFAYRHQVGQHLQRVGVVGHAGNHRHAAVLGQHVQRGLLVGAADDGVIVPPQCAGRVLHGFAAGGLQVVGAQVGAQAAHLENADFQARAGAGGVFGKHQCHRFALQILGVHALLMQALVLVGYIQNVQDFFWRQGA